MDRPIDRLRFSTDPYDLVTRLAFRTLKFLGLILVHGSSGLRFFGSRNLSVNT